MTPFYLLADALKKKKALLGRPENQAAKDRWDRAISDVIDLLLKVKAVPAGMGSKYQFDNPRLRPLAQILLDFARGRVVAHGSDLAGWTEQLNADLADALTGPLAAEVADGRVWCAAVQARLEEVVGQAMAGPITTAGETEARRISAFVDVALGRRQVFHNECAGSYYPFLPADEYFRFPPFSLAGRA